MDNTDGVHLWLVLRKAARSLEHRATKSIEKLGLCVSDFGVLEALLHKGPLPVNVLGGKVLLTSGSITTAIDRLEERSLVGRRNDPNDRRARIVHLTAEGRKLIEKLFAEHKKDMEAAASSLPQSDRAALVRLLTKLGRNVDELEGEVK